MLEFKPLSDFEPGIISDLLGRSYVDLFKSEPEYWKDEKENGVQFDKDAFENIQSIGACVFISCVDGQPIGLGAYDPRDKPLGKIGHNCIVPEFQGKGYGRLQLNEIIRRLKEQDFEKIEVVTNEHPFFVPAQKMYLACGFKEIERFAGEPDPRYKRIKYELEL